MGGQPVTKGNSSSRAKRGTCYASSICLLCRSLVALGMRRGGEIVLLPACPRVRPTARVVPHPTRRLPRVASFFPPRPIFTPGPLPHVQTLVIEPALLTHRREGAKMTRASSSIGKLLVLLGAAALTACGGSNGGDLGGGPDPSAISAAQLQPSGDKQSGMAGQDLANPMRIVVLRGSAPVAGAVVNWSTTAGGGSMTPSTSTTGADGISTSVWHLGTGAGAQSSQAAVSGGADGSPVRFTATAITSGGGGGGGGGGGPYGVQLLSDGRDHFEPASLTVPVGATVTWTWVSGFHSVTPTGTPSFTGNGPVSAPTTFSQTFTTAGTYLYYCLVHGTPTAGMRGTIVVQ
jgi:plastocyanin